MSKALTLIILCLFLPAAGISQDTLTKKDIRKLESNFLLPGNPWTIEIPLWIPGFGGEFAYGDVSIEGEDGVEIQNPIEPVLPGEGIGGILKRLFTSEWYLKFFYLTKVSYEQDKFKVQLDLIAGAVGHSVVFNYNNIELVEAHFLTVNARLYGAYQLLEVMGPENNFKYEAFAYGGIRTHFQRLQAELEGGTLQLDISPVLVEPIIGLENQFTWKRWFVVVQGDYGSIQSRNKKSFQLTAFAHYRMGGLTSLKFGWNHLHVNLTDRFIHQDYTVKLTLSGPVVALAFHF